MKAFMIAKTPTPPAPATLLGKRMHLLFLALPVTNGPLPTELKFRENTAVR